MTDTEIKEGDQVSWQWGSGQPGGKAAEVATEGEVTMTTKNNNEVKKKADSDNPAVYVERDGHDTVKKASELQVDEEGEKHKGGESEKDDDAEKKDGDAEKKGDDAEKKDVEADKENSEEKSESKSESKEDAEEQKNGDDKETNGDSKAGDKRKAEDDKKDDEKSDEKSDETKENGDAPPPKKKGRPAKNPNAPKVEPKKKEPKKAATETGEPRRSGRNRS